MIYACTCPECEGQEEQFDNVKKPSHYQGRFGLEAVDVIKKFCSLPGARRRFLLGERNQIYVALAQ